MERRLFSSAIIGLLLFTVAACSGDDEGEGTTTTAPPLSSTTTTTRGGTADPGGTTGSVETTTTVGSALSLPAYEIVRRDPGDAGDTVVVVLESDGTLTDIDLQNVVADIVDRFPPIYEAHVVDSPDAAAVVLDEAPDAATLALLAEHYLVRLEEGFRIVFTGPFSTINSTVLGS